MPKAALNVVQRVDIFSIFKKNLTQIKLIEVIANNL